MFGEAVVIPNPRLLPHMTTIIKQHGALLAKGRLLGIQFDELFKDHYMTLSAKMRLLMPIRSVKLVKEQDSLSI